MKRTHNRILAALNHFQKLIFISEKGLTGSTIIIISTNKHKTHAQPSTMPVTNKIFFFNLTFTTIVTVKMLLQDYCNNVKHAEKFCFNEVVDCFTVYETRDSTFLGIWPLIFIYLSFKGW